MGFLTISCKKATYLLSKKEAGSIRFWERWQLRSHLTICSLCRLFEQQTQWIGKQARLLHRDDVLPEKTRQEIIDKLHQINN
jgi:hypothetical protein